MRWWGDWCGVDFAGFVATGMGGADVGCAGVAGVILVVQVWGVRALWVPVWVVWVVWMFAVLVYVLPLYVMRTLNLQM